MLPDIGSKYTLTLEQIERQIRSVYYEDLDSDGDYEKIIPHTNSLGDGSYSVYARDGQVIDQWNFDSDFLSSSRSLSFLDFDKNGYKEIVHLTFSGDSLFLNYTEPLNENGIEGKKILIDKMLPAQGKYDPLNTEIFLYNEGNGSSGKYLFSVRSGFSAYPRNVYRFDPRTKSMEKSPFLTNNVILGGTRDLDKDGKEEVLALNHASGNTIDSAITSNSDYSAWITILDDDLSFYFPQVEIPVDYSAVRGIQEQEGKIFAIIQTGGSNTASYFLQLDHKGNVQDTVFLEGNANIVINTSEPGFAIHDLAAGNLFLYKNPLDFDRTISITPKNRVDYIDIDGDTNKEWVEIDANTSRITVYDSEFENPAVLDLPDWEFGNYWWGTRTDGDLGTHLWVRSESTIYGISYYRNPMYAIRYLVYLGILLACIGLVSLISLAQKYRLQQKRKLETQIAELQLKAIKNQVDPHFIFNAMNALGEMALTENKLEADRFITEFAQLMRKTLDGSDKIAHSLKEELAYVDNFIRLQHIRYAGKFEYREEVDEQVDLSALVPKQALFTYIENAIKHGMAGDSALKLKYGARHHPKGVLLFVEDNAGGMGNSELSKKFSTGSGLNIVEQIFSLYTRLTRRKVSHKLLNLQDGEGKTTG
ncbi:MAG: sensor histidine kinase, partial [Eudoraea sp.]|nr:sensor histidine kinase [Eudoraea sp.]